MPFKIGQIIPNQLLMLEIWPEAINLVTVFYDMKPRDLLILCVPYAEALGADYYIMDFTIPRIIYHCIKPLKGL